MTLQKTDKFKNAYSISGVGLRRAQLTSTEIEQEWNQLEYELNLVDIVLFQIALILIMFRRRNSGKSYVDIFFGYVKTREDVC